MGDVTSIVHAASRIVARPIGDNSAPAPVMITISVSPEIVSSVDHDAIWAGVDRAEILRRFVAAGFGK